MNNAPNSSLEARLNQLETSHRALEGRYRRMKLALGLAVSPVLLGGLLAASGWMNPGQAAAEAAAKRFSLVGDDGKELAAMELTSDGLPSVTLRDKSGGIKARFAVASNGLANVWMFGEEGKVRAQFGFDTKGPAMWLFDKEGTGRLVAGFSEGELPGMWLDDKEGQPVSRWVQNASGFASLEMLGTGGLRQSVLGMDDENRPMLWLYDERGVGRAILGFTLYGNPGLWLDDPQKKTRASLAMGVTGDCSFDLLDASGTSRATLSGEEGKEQLTLRNKSGETLFTTVK